MPVPQQGDSRAVADVIAEGARMYPIREFPGPRRYPTTGWMIVDLEATPPSSPDRPVTRTFQARELINDNISVHLPGLRTLSFFTEVRKLLVFCGRMGSVNPSVWDDKTLNELACGLAVQEAEIAVWTDDDYLCDGEERADHKRVVELFETATHRELERLTIHVSWIDSSLSQEFSQVRQQFRL